MALTKHKDIYSLDCPSGQVLANKVVLATNGYGDRATGTINKNVVPVQSVQVATIPLSDNVLKTITAWSSCFRYAEALKHFQYLTMGA